MMNPRPMRPASVTLGLSAIILIFALGLIFQPARWSATPAYGNLLLVLSAPVWGLLYLIVSTALLCAAIFPRVRFVTISAHTLAFILLASWEAAFVVRTITDTKTTIANVVAWGTYLAIVVFSAMRIEQVELIESVL